MKAAWRRFRPSLSNLIGTSENCWQRRCDVDVEEHPDVAFLLVAALLGARRTVQAAELLRRLETMTASRSDWRPWRARSEFLWAVYAEQTADIPGVLEHSAAATRLMGAAADHPSAVPRDPGMPPPAHR